MINAIRSQSKVLLGALFVLISASFLVIYNLPQFEGQMRGGDFGKIYGRNIDAEEFRFASQATQETARLTYGQELSQGAMLNNLTWERMILLATARKLHVLATDKEVADSILHLPIFQKEGKFDRDLYQGPFLKNYLPSRGLNEDRFEQIIREDVLIEKTQEAILAPVQVTEQEARQTVADIFGAIKVNVIRWNRNDFLKDVPVDQAAVEKEYHDHANLPDYRTLERRRVAYVTFSLPPDAPKAPEALAAAKRAVGEKATDFAVAALDKVGSDPRGWDTLVKDQGLTSVTTDFFNRNEAPKGLPPSPNFNRAAFDLKKDLPISEAVETDNGYLVLRLLDVQPSEMRPLAEVRAQVENNVRQLGASDVLLARANEAANTLKAEVAKGQTFTAAAQALKLPVESPAPFSILTLPPTLKDASNIIRLTRTLQPGQVSPVTRSENGAFLVELESRAEPDPTVVQQKFAQIQSSILQQRREEMMEEWKREQLQRADTRPPRALVEK